MLIRCEDCLEKKGQKWATLPLDYFQPRKAVAFWLRHGHIPKRWTFLCECGARNESGRAVAIENRWTDFDLAEHDWHFWEEHKEHGYRELRSMGLII